MTRRLARVVQAYDPTGLPDPAPARRVWSAANCRWEDGGGNPIPHGMDSDRNVIVLVSLDKAERQARALKSALSDLMIATERGGATSRKLADLYATSVMVYACANLRARAVASVPLRLVDGEGQDVPAAEPLARVLKAGLREVMRRSELAICFWGRNLLYKQRNAFGPVVGLRWLNPTLWTPETNFGRELVGFRIHRGMGDPERAPVGLLLPKDAVYLHLMDFADNFDGLAPAEVAFLEAGLEVEMATTAVSYFRSRAIPALILQPAKETQTMTGQALNPEGDNALILANFLRETTKGSKNAGRTIVQPARWEAVLLQQNFKDLAMSEMYRENRQQIAIASDIPLELVIPTSSNYAQLYDTRRGWYEGWVRPQVEWYCESFTGQLAAEVHPGWQVIPDFEGVAALKEDAAARQNRVTARVQAGLLDLGRAEITAAFRQAFLDGLRKSGVNTDELADDEEAELSLRIKAERTYFTALANDLYRKALPLYRNALDLQRRANEPGVAFEERASLQRQAVEGYRDFVRARERMEQRIDGYVFKGLEQIHTLGRLYGQKNKMQKWVRDPMKNSCRSCLALDGQVHRAREFLKYVIPQDSRLLCHGEKCGCWLEDTTERASRQRLDRVPLNRDAKGEAIKEYVGAIAAKSAGAVGIGFYVSLAGDPALVALRHRIAEALGRLDGILQAAMRWTSSHLHLFDVGGALYTVPSPDDGPEMQDEWWPRLNCIAFRENAGFIKVR